MSVEESTPECVAGSKLISITLHNAYHCGRVITIDGAYNNYNYYVGGVSLVLHSIYIRTCKNTGVMTKPVHSTLVLYQLCMWVKLDYVEFVESGRNW